ncbi:DUF6233 domain-containing protein [Streptomyces sp. NPDC016845]|uniref:DUF6233 domain-containing protein n=1 Tax=Streptomyces sp. NPDC016845 TaxID=3364972 RepID=UPI0037AAE644
MGLTGRSAVYVHASTCHMAGKRSRPINAAQARNALDHGPVPACPHCRPGTALGLGTRAQGRGACPHRDETGRHRRGAAAAYGTCPRGSQTAEVMSSCARPAAGCDIG